MSGGVRLAICFNFVLKLVKWLPVRLTSVYLHTVVLDELHVRNGILKIAGIQHDSTDRRDRFAQRVDTGCGADNCY